MMDVLRNESAKDIKISLENASKYVSRCSWNCQIPVFANFERPKFYFWEIKGYRNCQNHYFWLFGKAKISILVKIRPTSFWLLQFIKAVTFHCAVSQKGTNSLTNPLLGITRMLKKYESGRLGKSRPATKAISLGARFMLSTKQKHQKLQKKFWKAQRNPRHFR